MTILAHFCIAYDCFLLQSQSQTLAKEPFWSVMQGVFTIKPFTEKCSAVTESCSDSCSSRFLLWGDGRNKEINRLCNICQERKGKTHAGLSLSLSLCGSQSAVMTSIKMKNSIEETQFVLQNAFPSLSDNLLNVILCRQVKFSNLLSHFYLSK